MHSYFIPYFGFFSAEEDQICNGATLHIAYSILSIPCLLMPWWLKSPGHQQAWSWPNKPEYSISSIWRVNKCIEGLNKMINMSIFWKKFCILSQPFFHFAISTYPLEKSAFVILAIDILNILLYQQASKCHWSTPWTRVMVSILRVTWRPLAESTQLSLWTGPFQTDQTAPSA